MRDLSHVPSKFLHSPLCARTLDLRQLAIPPRVEGTLRPSASCRCSHPAGGHCSPAHRCRTFFTARHRQAAAALIPKMATCPLHGGIHTSTYMRARTAFIDAGIQLEKRPPVPAALSPNGQPRRTPPAAGADDPAPHTKRPPAGSGPHAGAQPRPRASRYPQKTRKQMPSPRPFSGNGEHSDVRVYDPGRRRSDALPGAPMRKPRRRAGVAGGRPRARGVLSTTPRPRALGPACLIEFSGPRQLGIYN